MIESPLLKYMHPAMVYRRTPLSDEENGLALLRAANESIVNDDDEIGHLYYAEEDCECGLADCLTCNYDYATIMRMLARVLEKNSRSLELYSQVLAKGRVQFPVPRNAPWFGGSQSDNNFDLDRLKSLEMRWACERGDLAAATRAVRERAQMAGIIGRGEGTVGNYILSTGILRAALRNALVLVEKPSVTPEALAELAKIEEFVLDEDDLAQTTRADFLITLDSIEAIERVPTLPERIDRLLAEFYAQKPLLNDGDQWDDEGRLAERRRQMHIVLDGHPRDWDAAATVRRLSARVAQLIKLDWQEAPADDDDTCAFWQHLPSQLQPHFSIEWFGDSASAAAAREADREYRAETEDEAASEEDLAAAREAIRSISNPIGLLVENALQPTDIRDQCRELGWTLEEKIRERSESR